MEVSNPFSPTFPVNPEYFANREEIIESFKIALKRSIRTALPRPDNIAILGDWGIGKTSMLSKFEAIALEMKKEDVFSAIVELGPTTCKSFSEFTRNVIEDVDTKFVATANIVSKIRRELKAWKLRSIGWRTTVLEKKVIPESSTFVLKSSLTELWKILEKAGIEIALLMLDDLHYLAEKYPDGLYDLRGIFQALPNQGCNYILCVAGKRELFTEIRELAEPLSRFFNIKHTLIPFNLMETEIAIKKPIEKAKVNLKLDNEVISQIFKLTSGHPYFIHFIMRELVSEKSGRINISDFEESYKKIEKLIGRDKFDVDFSTASEREREILLAAAKLDLTTFTPSDIKIKDARTKMSSLRKKNLIIKRNRGEYAIYHPLFKEYLRKRKVK